MIESLSCEIVHFYVYLEESLLISIYRGSKMNDERIGDHVNYVLSYDIAQYHVDIFKCRRRACLIFDAHTMADTTEHGA